MPKSTDKKKPGSDLKIPTEALTCSAQEQAIRTNCIKYQIDSPCCSMCGESGKTISHIVSEYSKLDQSGYKRSHGSVARMVHWKLCEKFDLKKSEKWYLHNPQTFAKSVNHKLM